MSEGGGFWDDDLPALQQKYWESWSEINRKAAGTEDSSPRQNPWELALEHWWQAVSPAVPATARDFMTRMMDQGRQLFRLAERFAGSGQEGGKTPDWVEVLDRLSADLDAAERVDAEPEARARLRNLPGFRELPFEAWQGLAAALSLVPGELLGNLPDGAPRTGMERLFSAPESGSTPAEQGQRQTLQRLVREYRRALQEYQRFFSATGKESIRRLGESLQRKSSDGESIDSARMLYDTWVETCEEVYTGRVMTPEYARLNGRLVNASLRVRNHLDAMLDGKLAALNLPTRAQVRTLHARMQENRRETRRLRAEVDALAARLADLPAARSRAGPAGKHKTAPRKKRAVKAPGGSSP